MNRICPLLCVVYAGLQANANYCGASDCGSPGVSHVQSSIRSGAVQSKGTNIGGWLVAEHWMTEQSDIWNNVNPDVVNHGEYQALTNFSSYSDAESFRTSRLQSFDWHRKNFITAADIESIASAGFNTIRVPVGYWIIGFDDYDISGKEQWKAYPSDDLDYLDQLIKDWAKTYNVAVLISMHAAKGSQSGAEHSSPESYGVSYFGSFPENVQSTLESVAFLADRYKYDEAFLGIGLLNEPSGSTTNEVLYNYYQLAYKKIRIEDGNDCILTVSPLLWEQGPDHFTDILPGATNVWVEWHRYFIWGFSDYSPEDILNKAIGAFQSDVELWKQRSDKKLYNGEWTVANTGQFKDHESLKRFAEKQIDIMSDTSEFGGWAYWSWRTYGDEKDTAPWSARNMIQNGILSPI